MTGHHPMLHGIIFPLVQIASTKYVSALLTLRVSLDFKSSFFNGRLSMQYWPTSRR